MTKHFDIDRLHVGPVSAYRNLAVWPLFGNRAAPLDYLTLDEALAVGTARITETSPDGTVGELLLMNDAGKPVLLLDGEELLGVKQNRICNLSILAGARSSTVIPVSCSEAGRWRWRSQTVSASRNVHFATSRARKAGRVTESLRSHGRADARQSEVWSEIDHKLASLQTNSSTAAISDVFDNSDDLINEFVCAITLPDGAVGAAFALNGKLAGVELFEAPVVFARLAKKLVRSWALDAIDHETQESSPPPREKTISEFLSKIAATPTENVTAPGVGKSVRFLGSDVIGGALFTGDRALHVLAFSSVFAAK